MGPGMFNSCRGMNRRVRLFVFDERLDGNTGGRGYSHRPKLVTIFLRFVRHEGCILKTGSAGHKVRRLRKTHKHLNRNLYGSHVVMRGLNHRVWVWVRVQGVFCFMFWWLQEKENQKYM